MKRLFLSGNVITSQDDRTAQQFSFEIVSFLKGEEFCNKLKKEVKWC